MPPGALVADSGLDYYAYLAELRSIGGLSGSPIYVMRDTIEIGGLMGLWYYRSYLLGLIRGHWDYRTGTALIDSCGDELRTVNMGIVIGNDTLWWRFRIAGRDGMASDPLLNLSCR